MNVAANPLPKKSKANAPRDKTAREKALEFARNVPKPKEAKAGSQADKSEAHREQYEDQILEDEEDFYEQSNDMGGTGTGAEEQNQI